MLNPATGLIYKLPATLNTTPPPLLVRLPVHTEGVMKGGWPGQPPYASDAGEGGVGDVPPYTSDAGEGVVGGVPPYTSDAEEGGVGGVPPYTFNAGEGGVGGVPPYTSDAGEGWGGAYHPILEASKQRSVEPWAGGSAALNPVPCTLSTHPHITRLP